MYTYIAETKFSQLRSSQDGEKKDQRVASTNRYIYNTTVPTAQSSEQKRGAERLEETEEQEVCQRSYTHEFSSTWLPKQNLNKAALIYMLT